MTSPPSFVGPLLAYTLARLCLVAAVAGLLVVAGGPPLLAVFIGGLTPLPLWMLLLRSLGKQWDPGLTARGPVGPPARGRPEVRPGGGARGGEGGRGVVVDRGGGWHLWLTAANPESAEGDR